MSEFELKITEETEGIIISLVKWSRIAAYLGFILACVFALFGAFMIINWDDEPNKSSDYELASILFAFGVFLFTPSYLALKSSMHLKLAVIDSVQSNLNAGLSFAAKFFKSIVVSIIAFILVCYLLINFL